MWRFWYTCYDMTFVIWNIVRSVLIASQSWNKKVPEIQMYFVFTSSLQGYQWQYLKSSQKIMGNDIMAHHFPMSEVLSTCHIDITDCRKLGRKFGVSSSGTTSMSHFMQGTRRGLRGGTKRGVGDYQQLTIKLEGNDYSLPLQISCRWVWMPWKWHLLVLWLWQCVQGKSHQRCWSWHLTASINCTINTHLWMPKAKL